MRVLATLALVVFLGLSSFAQDAPVPPIKVQPDVLAGKLVSRVSPVYPPLARQARIQGTVVMAAIIGKNGAVANLRLISGHPMLAPAAMEAVRKWQYAPSLIEGKPVVVDTTIQVNFELRENAGPLPNPSQFMTVTPPGSEDSTALLAVKTETPVYPLGAGQTMQGRVWVRLHVSETGEVISAESLSDDAFFAKAVTDAAQEWRFEPFLRNDVAIPVTTSVLFVVAPAGARLDDLETGQPTAGPGTPEKSDSEDVPWRARVSSGVMSGLLVNRLPPEYPVLAKASHVEGTVVLQAHISKEGAIIDLRPVSGYQVLANASVAAVKEWRYKPYLLMGMPVEVETQIELQFNLQ